jgi:hypothetical protein
LHFLHSLKGFDMTTLSSFSLTASLISKHFGKLGDLLNEQIAKFDPETATEVDRDRLVESLRQSALKLAEARRNFDTEKKEFDDLQAQIKSDSAAIDVLLKRHDAGEVDDATLYAFADELEAQKSRLPGEQQDAESTKQLVESLEEIIGTLKQRLDAFDGQKKQAMAMLAQANADKQRAQINAENAQLVASLKGAASGHNSAMGALVNAANRARDEAAAAQIVTQAQSGEANRLSAVERARQLAAGAPTSETAADRLRRLAAA